MPFATLLRNWIRSSKANTCRKSDRRDFLPTVEGLEERLVPYAVTGYSWAGTAISASFIPDGASCDGTSCNLFSTLNALHSTAAWQREFARALQTWASVSPLNFQIVSDNASATGISGQAQGDSRFGDIRLGAFGGNGYLAYAHDPSQFSTAGGDVMLNSNYQFNIGASYDLYSVLLHEVGHALGMDHSGSAAVMYGTYSGMWTGLTADDIAGIQSIYGTRQADAFDAAAANNALTSATAISLDGSGMATANADLTSLADVDYFQFTAPASFDGTFSATVNASGISLLAPQVSVYDATGTLLATVSSGYGTSATVNLAGLTAGQTYTIMADGATSDVFGTGAFGLSVQFGGVTGSPTPAPEAAPAQAPAPAPAPVLTADRLESNNTVSTASRLGTTNSVTHTGLSVHTATDADYFTFTAKDSGTYQVSLAFASVHGNLDMVVYNSRQKVIVSGTSLGDNEAVSFSVVRGQKYFVKVLGKSGGKNAYDFRLNKVLPLSLGLDHDHEEHSHSAAASSYFSVRGKSSAAGRHPAADSDAFWSNSGHSKSDASPSHANDSEWVNEFSQTIRRSHGKTTESSLSITDEQLSSVLKGLTGSAIF